MADVNWVDIFLVILIGMGPVKAALAFLEASHDASSEVRRAMALRASVTAAAVALILLVAGAFFMRVLHFSTGALTVAGGLILLVLAMTIVLSPAPPPKHGAANDASSLLSMAVFPIAIPLTLNPVGIVALTTISADADSLGKVLGVAAMVLVVAAIDFGVFVGSHGLARFLSQERILVLEKLLGILLAALAVQLILNGLGDVGVITLSEAGQSEH